MPTYEYEAVDKFGDATRGKLDAASVATAVQELARRGFDVTSIRRLSGAPESIVRDFDEVAGHRRMTENLQRALDRREQWLPMLQGLANDLPKGAPKRHTLRLVKQLAEPLTPPQLLHHRDASVLIPLIGSGSKSEYSAAQLNHWLSDVFRQHQNRVARRNALLYPALLLVLALAVMSMLATLVIPVYRSLFEDFGLSLPAPTLMVIGLSDAILNATWWHWLGVLGVVLLIASLTWVWRHHSLTNRILGGFVAGTNGNLRAMAGMAATAAELIHLEAPPPVAIRVAGECSQHVYFRRASERFAERLAKGGWRTGTFSALPPLMTGALASDWSAPQQSFALREVATVYRERIDHRFDWMTAGLPTMAMILIGLTVGFVAVALLMPMVSMITSLA